MADFPKKKNSKSTLTVNGPLNDLFWSIVWSTINRPFFTVDLVCQVLLSGFYFFFFFSCKSTTTTGLSFILGSLNLKFWPSVFRLRSIYCAIIILIVQVAFSRHEAGFHRRAAPSHWKFWDRNGLKRVCNCAQFFNSNSTIEVPVSESRCKVNDHKTSP